MKKAIIGKKLGMTQIFTADGLVVPVTVVEAGPCTVVQKKTEEKEGYNSVVVAFEEQKESRLNKAQLGTYKKANVPAAMPIPLHKPDKTKKIDLSNIYRVSFLFGFGHFGSNQIIIIFFHFYLNRSWVFA